MEHLSVDIRLIIYAVVSIGFFLWRLSRVEIGIHRDVSEIKERLAGVEATLAIISNGLHIEVKGRGAN